MIYSQSNQILNYEINVTMRRIFYILVFMHFVCFSFKIFIPSHRKLRRSTRRRTKVKPENVLSFPFPSSPERKRKRSTADSESETGELFELVYIDKPYDSDDDPDYDPADDPNRGEGSGSDSSGTVEASEDDDDDNNDNDDDDDVDDDDDDDSGEGDENDSSPVGGKTLKPEEVTKKSPKSDSVALKGIGAGQSATLIVHVKDNKETIEVMMMMMMVPMQGRIQDCFHEGECTTIVFRRGCTTIIFRRGRTTQ